MKILTTNDVGQNAKDYTGKAKVQNFWAVDMFDIWNIVVAVFNSTDSIVLAPGFVKQTCNLLSIHGRKKPSQCKIFNKKIVKIYFWY